MTNEYTEEERMRDYRELFNRVNAAAGGLIYDTNTGLLDWKRVNIALDKGLEEALCGLCADDEGKFCIRAFANLKRHNCIDENGKADGVKALKEGLEKDLRQLYPPEALRAWNNDLLLEPFIDEEGNLNLVESVKAGITNVETYADFGVTQAEIDKCLEMNN